MKKLVILDDSFSQTLFLKYFRDFKSIDYSLILPIDISHTQNLKSSLGAIEFVPHIFSKWEVRILSMSMNIDSHYYGIRYFLLYSSSTLWRILNRTSWLLFLPFYPFIRIYIKYFLTSKLNNKLSDYSDIYVFRPDSVFCQLVSYGVLRGKSLHLVIRNTDSLPSKIFYRNLYKSIYIHDRMSAVYLKLAFSQCFNAIYDLNGSLCKHGSKANYGSVIVALGDMKYFRVEIMSVLKILYDLSRISSLKFTLLVHPNDMKSLTEVNYIFDDAKNSFYVTSKPWDKFVGNNGEEKLFQLNKTNSDFASFVHNHDLLINVFSTFYKEFSEIECANFLPESITMSTYELLKKGYFKNHMFDYYLKADHLFSSVNDLRKILH